MIELFCPECDHHLRIQNKYAGKEGKCRYCDNHFFVPMDIIETPSDLKPEPEEKLRTPKEGDPLPGVAKLPSHKKPKIKNTIFDKSPESTATPALFEAHLSASKDGHNTGLRYWFKYILIAIIIIVVLGALFFTQLK